MNIILLISISCYESMTVARDSNWLVISMQTIVYIEEVASDKVTLQFTNKHILNSIVPDVDID